jgi:hypothetical protein
VNTRNIYFGGIYYMASAVNFFFLLEFDTHLSPFLFNKRTEIIIKICFYIKIIFLKNKKD